MIFTLKLKNSSARENAPIADHIVGRYAADLTCFSVGNEPTTYIKSFSEYETLVKSYMEATSRDAKFCGADVEDKGQWAADYADAFKGAPNIRLVTEHHYLGNGRKNVGALGRDTMLSSKIEADYSEFFNGFGPSVAKDGFSFRLSETNSFFHGGAVDASDTFASALWGLDYLHWWAAHGAAGLNFHTGDTVSSQVGGPNRAAVYAVFVSSQSGYHMRPLGFGIKAFDIGGHGAVVPVTIANSDGINLTAYAVLRSTGNLYVTIINKEHAAGARSAKVTVVTDSTYRKGAAMFLLSPENEVSAKDGVTLGGAVIDDDGTWKGTFSELSGISQGKFAINLSSATAVVLHLQRSE